MNPDFTEEHGQICRGLFEEEKNGVVFYPRISLYILNSNKRKRNEMTITAVSKFEILLGFQGFIHQLAFILIQSFLVGKCESDGNPVLSHCAAKYKRKTNLVVSREDNQKKT